MAIKIDDVRILQDYAEQDRQDALWRQQHPTLVKAMRVTVLSGVVMVWYVALRLGYLLWCLYQATK